MSTHVQTKGIILSRIDFGEADRILTVITPTHGKVRLMAKGVRKIKSKLAGGIELFSVSELSFIPGKGDISTLVSTRLQKYFSNIVTDIDRTMFGYELLKRLNRATEDATGEEYFGLLEEALKGLDDLGLDLRLLELWFNAQLIKLAGHSPGLKKDAQGRTLSKDEQYTFDLDIMAFVVKEKGSYNARHIKLIRLAFGLSDPVPLQQINDAQEVMGASQLLVQSMLTQFIRH